MKPERALRSVRGSRGKGFMVIHDGKTSPHDKSEHWAKKFSRRLCGHTFLHEL